MNRASSWNQLIAPATQLARLSARNRKNEGGGRILCAGRGLALLSIAGFCSLVKSLSRGNDRLREERARSSVKYYEADHRASRDVNHDIMRAAGSLAGTLIEATSLAKKAGHILGRLLVANPSANFSSLLVRVSFCCSFRVSLSLPLSLSLVLFISSVFFLHDQLGRVATISIGPVTKATATAGRPRTSLVARATVFARARICN